MSEYSVILPALVTLPLICFWRTQMANISDLLSGLGDKDQIYHLQCRFTNLHATQGRNDGELPREHKAIDSTSTTTHTEGLATGETTMPVTRQRGRRKNTVSMIQAYQFERLGGGGTADLQKAAAAPKKKGKGEHETALGPIILEVGGPYGLLQKGLRDTVVAKGKGNYWLPGMSLISFRPVKPLDEVKLDWVALGTKTSTMWDLRVEPRNSNKPGAPRPMVPVYHEALAEPVTIDIEMVVNAECPRSAEEIAGLLHAMQSMPFGPARRGKLTIVECRQIQ